MIAQNKVLVRAGRFQGGKLPYVNYVGQIKPADMASIVWYGAFGDDTTGDGTISTPYETFAKALAEFSTITHKWVLNTDLTVYGESEPAAFIDDPADRVYLDPTKADDSGDGLTAANAKKTYAAAKTVLGSSGRAVIHCIGTFTLTDLIDAPIQGEVGETLTYDAASSYLATEVVSSSGGKFLKAIVLSTGTIIAIGDNTAAARLYRSTDGGVSWSQPTLPGLWVTGRFISDIQKSAADQIVCVSNMSVSDLIASDDDGVTWTSYSIGHTTGWSKCVHTGTHWLLMNSENETIGGNRIYKSPDLVSWTAISTSAAAGWAYIAIESDGNGKVVICGRKTSTTPCAQYSTDHGSTWTDISASIGVGANTGGAICADVKFENGKWYIIQDTISVALYFTTNPSGAWSSMSDAFNISHLDSLRGVNLSWSDLLGGFIYAQTTSLGNEIGVLNETSYTAITTSIGGYDNNYGLLVFGSGQSQKVIILGKDSSGNAKIKLVGLAPSNVRATVTNIQADTARQIQSSAGVDLNNITAEPTAGIAVVTLEDAKIMRSRIVSADEKAISHAGNTIKLKRCIVKGVLPSSLQATAAATGDVEIVQNVIAGGMNLDNVAGTDKETIQDNIIVGNFSATELVTVKSNVSGAVVNSTSQSVVSTIPPIFVDTTDFFLSRIALGQTVDSPLISRSAYFTFTYSAATFKDDFGPYRAFTALVETVYKRAFLLPHFSGNALSEDVENVAALLKSIRGKPDVSNRPQGRLEIVSWQSKSVNSEVREFVSFMEKEKDLTVYIDYDFNGQAPDAVTIDGVHTSGTFELNIVPQDIPVGTVLSLFGKSQIVTQRYPRAGQATKLILDDVLSGGLVDTESVQVTYIQGAGTFVFVPSRPRKNLRIFARSRGSYSGMTYTFVRKAE